MAIKIWISKNSEISIREQIITQISLGIVSGDLQAGEKLPSTRELARRFQIHQNTVSAAYRELAERNKVEFKKGSGVYILQSQDSKNAETGADALDHIINRFLQEAETHGFSTDEMKVRLQKRFAASTATRFLVIESDAELRKILIEEISAVIKRRVDGLSFEDLAKNDLPDDAPIQLLFDTAKESQKKLPSAKKRIFLKANSVPNSMMGKTRPSENELIAIVSGWGKFLELAKTFLLAARIAPEMLVLRSTKTAKWQKGLEKVSLIICDSVTAKEFAADNRVRGFQMIADSSLDKIRKSLI